MRTSLLLLLPSVIACGGGVATITPDAGDGGTKADATVPTCNGLGAEVAVDDQPSIHPGYAIDGCRLAYVQRGSQRLVLRDLATGTEQFLTVAPVTPKDVPRRPTLGSDTVAWESGSPSAVMVWKNGVATEITGPFDHASEPRAFGGSVVFTAWLSADALGDTDVYVWDVAAASPTLIAGGQGQQRFADLNARFVAFTDFTEDPDGRFDGNETDLADVVIYDRASKVTTPRKYPGKEAFPVLVGDDVFGYLHWGDVHPEPKFQAFGVRGARVGTAPSSDVIVADVTNASRFWLPSGGGGTLDWIAPDKNGKELLWRAPVDGSAVKTSVLDGFAFAGAPQSSSAMTIVALRNGPSSTLRAIPR